MKDELAKRLVQGLKSAGINFVTYLPETRLSQIVPLIRDDPEMELVAVSSEQEAVTIAVGADPRRQASRRLHGKHRHLRVELQLARDRQAARRAGAFDCRFPGRCARSAQQFSLCDHRQPHDSGAARIGYRVKVLEDGEKLEIKISDAVRAANALRAPYALLFAGEFSV